MKALKPGDRVLVIGNSSEPWLAAKKDERVFIGFWSKLIPLPLPDYASRRVSILLWVMLLLHDCFVLLLDQVVQIYCGV